MRRSLSKTALISIVLSVPVFGCGSANDEAVADSNDHLVIGHGPFHCDPLSATLSAHGPFAVEVGWGMQTPAPVVITVKNHNDPSDAAPPVTVNPNGAGIGQWIVGGLRGNATYDVSVGVATGAPCAPWTGSVVLPIEQVYAVTPWASAGNANGWGELLVKSDGHWNYSGNAGNNGFFGTHYLMGMIPGWRDPLTGDTVAFQNSGFLDGESDPFSSRTDSWSQDGYDPNIPAIWDQVVAAMRTAGQRYTFQVNSNVLDVFGSLGEAAGLFVGAGLLVLFGGNLVVFAGSPNTHCYWMPPDQGGGYRCEGP